MVIRDRLVKWYIQNIWMPKIDIFDKPGFIITKFTEKGRTVYLREIFFPELLFVELENAVVKEYQNKGAKALYSAGKKVGYLFSEMSAFLQLESATEKKFLEFVDLFIKYIESIWASKMQHEVDIKSKSIKFYLTDYIVCSKNGLGHILTSGGAAGIWAYLINDISVEGVQTQCQGRGKKYCELICAPKQMLINSKLTPFDMQKLEIVKDKQRYIEFNQIRNTEFAKKSFQDLVNSGLFKYAGGQMTYNGERHFYCDTSLIYFLELELKSLPNSSNLLFNTAFDWAKRMTEKLSDKNTTFLTDYLSALGFGDVVAIKKGQKYNVLNNYFPWMEQCENINFSIYRGIVSGMLSGLLGKNILLKKIQISTQTGHLSMVLSE